MQPADPSSDTLERQNCGGGEWGYLFAGANLRYKQILLIQYSVLKDWPLVNPQRREEY